MFLVVSGLGHVPAIKNSMFGIVQKSNREWKRRCVSSFEYQLFSLCPTTESGTLTAEQVRSLIALLPPDDRWQIVSELHITVRKVDPGKEGAEVTIETI